MTINKRTKIALTILGLTTAGAFGYLVWSYLAPPPAITAPFGPFLTEVKTEVVSDANFKGLQPYADLPIEPTNVGRPDPFAPFPLANENGNSNKNINAR